MDAIISALALFAVEPQYNQTKPTKKKKKQRYTGGRVVAPVGEGTSASLIGVGI